MPQNVKLVCSNGMKTSDLVVTNRDVRIASGNLIATVIDKPKNFGCKWIGILVALIAIIVVPMLITVGPLALALIATAAGVLGSLGAGVSGIPLCYLATMNSNWELHHTTVRIGPNKDLALLDVSTLTCSIFSSGKIFIFYNRTLANKQATAFALRNTVEIFAAANIGAFGAGIVNIAKTSGLLSTQMGIHALFGTAYYTVAEKLDNILDSARDATADVIVERIDGKSSPASGMAEHKDKTNSEYEENTFYADESVLGVPRDAGVDYADYEDGTKKIPRAERRGEYNKKGPLKKDKNGTLRRDPNKPKSLNHAASEAARGKKGTAAQEAKAPYKEKARTIVRNRRIAKSAKSGVKSFLAGMGISWVIDVAAVSMQKHIDNHMDEEVKSREAIGVIADEH